MAGVKKGLLATLSLATAVALSACSLTGLFTPRVGTSGGLDTGDFEDARTGTTARTVSNGKGFASITGFAVGPATLVGNNSAGLVGVTAGPAPRWVPHLSGEQQGGASGLVRGRPGDSRTR
jgi:hypothetical protein